MRRTTLAAAIAFTVVAMLAPGALGAPPSIPDDWFFEGAQRPATLKQLEGKPAPEISTESWIGDSQTIAANRGKVIILDFWATWCGPCMAAVPENVKLMSAHTDGDLVFIGMHDTNSGWEKAPQVVKDKKINYPVAKDKGGASAKAYNLQFFPTYVAIDRTGTVRAVGLLPNRVAEVAEMLLKEGAPTAAAAPATVGEFPAECYAGGAKRPTALRAIEGKPAPELRAQQWIGTPVTPEATKGSVVVLQFTAPGSRASQTQLAELARLRKDFATQGVVVAAVCAPSADWKAMGEQIAAAKLEVPVAQDAAATPAAPAAGDAKPADAKPADTKPADAKPPARGVTATAYGVQFAPVTIVIDRSGKVRIAGARMERVRTIVEQLLAEPAA
ncbi:MAG: redoxin domain-containing protein [Phycisphaerales bacterium]